MFAEGAARAFLESITRWAFENDLCFPQEVETELREFADQIGQPYEEIRLRHYHRLHAFYPEDRKLMDQYRRELNTFFRPIQVRRDLTSYERQKQNHAGYRVQKSFGHNALKAAYQDFSKNASL